MWYLTSENDNRVMYIITSANQVVIGRSVDNEVCNFAIPDDPSISRKHATLTIVDNSLLLQDLGSRYGTFINNDRAAVNTNIKLNENDVVKFGKMNSIWNVNVANLTTCTSTLKGENLNHLKQTLSKIGGLLKSDWDDTCNYLTMPAITLTIKVVLALVQGSNIVTTEFWSKCLENVNNLVALPDPHEFIPQVVESTLNKEVVSFLPDTRRKALFEGKKFIFFSRRQYEMYKTVLIKSGASPMLLSECRMTISMLCGPDIIVIQYTATGVSQETQSQKNQVNDIINQLKSKGKRVVADAEIGLAILYCSNDKYCNPNFSFTSEVMKQTSAPVKSSKVIAHESQEPASQQRKTNCNINESLMSEDNNESLSTKRKLGEFTSLVQGNPNKKLVTNCYIAEVKTESNKRKFSEDGDSSNPSKKITMNKEDNSNEMSFNPSEQGDNENSDDMFNFVKTAPATSAGTGRKLNLTRPQKRKLNDSNEDENLFNFVQTTTDVKADSNTSKQNLFNINKKKKDDSDGTESVHSTKSVGITADDISAMRGSKLKELMERNLTYTSNTMNNIKEEKTGDLEDKMDKLDLCSTIVTTCNNLIIKREPYKTETENSFVTSVKNFKKFKKVWPVKRQVTIINATTMSAGNITDSVSNSPTVA